MKSENVFDAIIMSIKKAKHIVIASHENPDGDSIGSMVSLYLALSSLGKQPLLFTNGPIPMEYMFLLDGAEGIIVTDDPQKIAQMDLLIFLDCTDKSRVGRGVDQLLNFSSPTINIDHHIDNTNFASINYLDTAASSTGELVFDLIQVMKLPLTKSMANAMYTAIATDTGSFRFDNTTEKAFLTAAALIRAKADLSKIRINLWENKPSSSIGLLKDILHTLEFACEGKLATLTANRELMEKWNASNGDLEGFINYPKAIGTVEIAAIFKETTSDEVKVSLRAKRDVSVQKIAQHFGGGGHRKAAGFTSHTGLNETKRTVIEYIEKIFSNECAKHS